MSRASCRQRLAVVPRKLTGIRRAPHTADDQAPDGLQRVIYVGIFLMQIPKLVVRSLGAVLGEDNGLCIVTMENDLASALSGLNAEPDVVLVDDLSLASRVRAERPHIRLIVLGAADESAFVLSCIRAGAIACIARDATLPTLIDVIKRVYQGEVVYNPTPMLELLLRPDLATKVKPERTATLGARELEVLGAIATGLSTEEAADQLGISVHTLRTHIKHIVAKVNARSKLDAVLIAIREGRISLQSHPAR